MNCVPILDLSRAQMKSSVQARLVRQKSWPRLDNLV
jgi:hypothetical protein